MTILDVSIVNVALPSIGNELDFSRREPAVGGQPPTRSRSAASSCSAGARPTCSGAGACSCSASRSSRPPRSPAGSRTRGVLIAIARRAGARRRDHLAGGALDRDDDVRRRAPSGTRRSASGARSAGAAPRSACSLGGMLTKYLGWEWIFFVNVPVGIAVARATRALVPESRIERTRRRYDALGARHRSRRASLCSSTRSRRRPTSAGARRGRSACSRSPSLLLALFLVIETRASTARAAEDLPGPDGRRRELVGFWSARHLRELLPAHALHAAGARLLGAQDGRRVPDTARDRVVSAGVAQVLVRGSARSR